MAEQRARAQQTKPVGNQGGSGRVGARMEQTKRGAREEWGNRADQAGARAEPKNTMDGDRDGGAGREGGAGDQ